MWELNRDKTVRASINADGEWESSESAGAARNEHHDAENDTGGVLRVTHTPLSEAAATALYADEPVTAPPFASQSEYAEVMNRRGPYGGRLYETDADYRGWVIARLSKTTSWGI